MERLFSMQEEMVAEEKVHWMETVMDVNLETMEYSLGKTVARIEVTRNKYKPKSRLAWKN
jgi:hypothetical protein